MYQLIQMWYTAGSLCVVAAMEELALQIQTMCLPKTTLTTSAGRTRSITRGPDERVVHLYPHSDDTSRGR